MNQEKQVNHQSQPLTQFQDPFSEEVWRTTYKDHKDNTVDDTFRRVAKAIASVEETPELKAEWEAKFFDMMSDFKGIPGGRILSNAGTEWYSTTLMNCFVGSKGDYDIDSLSGIMDDIKGQAATLKSEGGFGFSFCLKFDEPLYFQRNTDLLYDQIINVKKGDKVYGRDGQLHEVEETLVRTGSEMVKLTLEDGSTISCTVDHPFLVRRDNVEQYVEAGDLLDTDELVALDGCNG